MSPVPRLGAWLLVALVAASGCTTTRRPETAATPVADPRAFLQSRTRFDLAGRLAGAVGGEGFNAQLQMQQRDARSELVLRSPLGFGSATIRTDGESLEYRSSRGERLSGAEGMAAVAARLGFEPPVRSLRYWLLGVPDPASPSTAIASAPPAGAAFEQDGWRVTVGQTRSTALPAGTIDLPRRVTLERPPVRLRVVVDTWKLDR